MEVFVKYGNGFRFLAACKGYTVTTGRGEDGNQERDGMWPPRLFEALIVHLAYTSFTWHTYNQTTVF
jgi:hypothetical protein